MDWLPPDRIDRIAKKAVSSVLGTRPGGASLLKETARDAILVALGSHDPTKGRSLEGYAYDRARYAVLDALKAGRALSLIYEPAAPPSVIADDEAISEEEAYWRRLDEAALLSLLSGKRRRAILHTLGIAVGATRGQVHHAVKTLREASADDAEELKDEIVSALADGTGKKRSWAAFMLAARIRRRPLWSDRAIRRLAIATIIETANRPEADIVHLGCVLALKRVDPSAYEDDWVRHLHPAAMPTAAFGPGGNRQPTSHVPWTALAESFDRALEENDGDVRSAWRLIETLRMASGERPQSPELLDLPRRMLRDVAASLWHGWTEGETRGLEVAKATWLRGGRGDTGRVLGGMRHSDPFIRRAAAHAGRGLPHDGAIRVARFAARDPIVLVRHTAPRTLATVPSLADGIVQEIRQPHANARYLARTYFGGYFAADMERGLRLAEEIYRAEGEGATYRNDPWLRHDAGEALRHGYDHGGETERRGAVRVLEEVLYREPRHCCPFVLVSAAEIVSGGRLIELVTKREFDD